MLLFLTELYLTPILSILERCKSYFSVLIEAETGPTRLKWLPAYPNFR